MAACPRMGPSAWFSLHVQLAIALLWVERTILSGHLCEVWRILPAVPDGPLAGHWRINDGATPVCDKGSMHTVRPYRVLYWNLLWDTLMWPERIRAVVFDDIYGFDVIFFWANLNQSRCVRMSTAITGWL